MTDWTGCHQPTEPASIAYYSGQLPNTLIDWLAQCQRAPEIYFFPDYYGVGLLNFARIRARVGNSVSFWLMPQWSTRLERFGCVTPWQDTRREFNTMLAHPATAEFEAEVKQLIRLMQTEGLGLEQEAV